jgi:outer membrane protein TolC
VNKPNKPEHHSVVIFGPPSAISQSTPRTSAGITPLPSLASSSLSQPDSHSGSSLYDLVQTVIDHNAHIRLAAQNLRSANAGSLQAIGNFLPHLSFQEQSQMYVNSSGLPSASLVGSNIVETQGSIYSNYMSIMASLNLFEGGSGIENLSAAHQGVVAAREQILHQQNTAVLDLLVNFQQIQSLLQQEVILRKAISLAKEDLSLNEQRFRRGNESVLELNKARVLLLQYQSQNDDLRRRLLKSQTELAALLGQQGAFALVREAGHETIPTPPEPGQNANNETEDTDIVNHLPTIQADLANMREARHHVASVRGSFLPDVNIQAGYNWLGTSSHGFGPAFNNVNRNNYTVGLSITQSLGPFTGHLAKLHDAEAKLESAHIQYQQAILEGHQQLRVDREEIRVGEKRVQTLHEEFISAQKSLQLVTALYKHGRVSKMDVHTAQLQAMNAQGAWQSARGEWVVAQWMFYAMLHPGNLVHTFLEQTRNIVQESSGPPGGHRF